MDSGGVKVDCGLMSAKEVACENALLALKFVDHVEDVFAGPQSDSDVSGSVMQSLIVFDVIVSTVV